MCCPFGEENPARFAPSGAPSTVRLFSGYRPFAAVVLKVEHLSIVVAKSRVSLFAGAVGTQDFHLVAVEARQPNPLTGALTLSIGDEFGAGIAPGRGRRIR